MVLPVCKTLVTREVTRNALSVEIDAVVNGWLGRNPNIRIITVSTAVFPAETGSATGVISIVYYPVEDLSRTDLI